MFLFLGDIMEFLNTLLEYLQSDWVAAVTGVVTAATAITALTPTTADDKIVNFVLKILNILAGNFLKNTNADTDPVE